MAIINFTGFETGLLANEGASGTLSASSGVSITTTAKKSGAYGLEANIGNGSWGTYYIGKINTTTLQEDYFSAATIWITFYFKILTMPASGVCQICYVQSTSAGRICNFNLSSAGKLGLVDKNLTNQQTGTTVLSTDTWYKLDFKTGSNNASCPFEIRINGVSDLSGTYDCTSTNPCGVVILGNESAAPSAVKFYYDDVVVDDAAYFVGTPTVLRIAPTANGTTAQWTGGTGSSDYSVVDEIPADAADYIQKPASASRHLVALQNCTTVGILSAPKAVKTWVMIWENTSGTSSTAIALRSGGTNYDSAGVNTSNSSAATNTNRYQINLTDPKTSGAWNLRTIDSLQIGVYDSTAVIVKCGEISAFCLFDAATTEVILYATADGYLNNVSGWFGQEADNLSRNTSSSSGDMCQAFMKFTTVGAGIGSGDTINSVTLHWDILAWNDINAVCSWMFYTDINNLWDGAGAWGDTVQPYLPSGVGYGTVNEGGIPLGSTGWNTKALTTTIPKSNLFGICINPELGDIGPSYMQFYAVENGADIPCIIIGYTVNAVVGVASTNKTLATTGCGL